MTLRVQLRDGDFFNQSPIVTHLVTVFLSNKSCYDEHPLQLNVIASLIVYLVLNSRRLVVNPPQSFFNFYFSIVDL